MLNSDVKLEKAIDMMIQEVENMENANQCPLYHWLNDFRMEISEMNTANLKTQIPIPSLDESVCEDCPVED